MNPDPKDPSQEPEVGEQIFPTADETVNRQVPEDDTSAPGNQSIPGDRLQNVVENPGEVESHNDGPTGVTGGNEEEVGEPPGSDSKESE